MSKKRKGKAKRRAALFLVQEGRCCYCFCDMVLKHGNPTEDFHATLEHKVPASFGGCGFSNELLSCRKCNSVKSDMLHDDFMMLLACCGISIANVVFYLKWAASLTRQANRERRKRLNAKR